VVPPREEEYLHIFHSQIYSSDGGEKHPDKCGTDLSLCVTIASARVLGRGVAKLDPPWCQVCYLLTLGIASLFSTRHPAWWVGNAVVRGHSNINGLYTVKASFLHHHSQIEAGRVAAEVTW